MRIKPKLLFLRKELYVATALVLVIALVGLYGARPTYTKEESFLREFKKRVSSCASGKSLAQNEIAHGDIRMIIEVGFDSDSTSMPQIFYAMLEKEYGVKIVRVVTCTGMTGVECYNDHMRLALEKKFGKEHLAQLYESMHIAQYGPRK
ncbi:hypothetical protein [Nibribacter koreensis]|uniref:Uncharacterized protein n=1 Tax=Nibribacter koreensis TaxID=1084519 RepID=A0ABP8G193_9BACT